MLFQGQWIVDDHVWTIEAAVVEVPRDLAQTVSRFGFGDAHRPAQVDPGDGPAAFNPQPKDQLAPDRVLSGSQHQTTRNLGKGFVKARLNFAGSQLFLAATFSRIEVACLWTA